MWCCARARATRRWRSRCRTPTGPAGCGCTSASTSAPPDYLAIGLAIAAGTPVCVAMTSGTAVANLGPAVVEANYARVPLIVLSANRPYEMLGTGANQTMEQLGYFGTQVRATISLGLAEDAPDRMDALNATWRSATCRVLVAADRCPHRQRRPGALRHPAARAAGARPGALRRAVPPGRPDGRPWTYTPPVSFDQPLDIDLTPTPSSSPVTAQACTPNLAASADGRRAHRAPGREPAAPAGAAAAAARSR